MTPVEIKRGDSPLVLGLPHTGTDVPDDFLPPERPPARRLATPTGMSTGSMTGC
jgi:N-formylglutamate deformylase